MRLQLSLRSMLPGQMSPWHLSSVKNGILNQISKFGPDLKGYNCHWDKCGMENVDWTNVLVTVVIPNIVGIDLEVFEVYNWSIWSL